MLQKKTNIGDRSAGDDTPTFRCVVAYDGTPYRGFQIQIGEPTVQAELEKAVERITQHAARVVAAGRTDAGVHASGQVVHFKAPWLHAPSDLRQALNAVLPKSVAVAEVSRAKAGFHARYSASSRWYRYDILNTATRSPLLERFALHRSRPLHAPAMHEALQDLVGSHDFRAFAAGEPEDATTVREVIRTSCRRDGDMVRVCIGANAFLRHMVRRIVGTALEIGEGRKPVDHMKRVLASANKALAGPTAPAKGLYLVRVKYPASAGLVQE